jgi:hypothetical protein
MEEQKIFSNWQFDLIKIKKKVSEITKEPVFIKREIISILEALDAKCIEKWIKLLKNGKKLAEFGISSKNFSSNKFYTLNDLWELLLNMDQAGIINLATAGLNTIQDLAEFEIPIYEKDSSTNIWFDCDHIKKKRKNSYEDLNTEGFWENGIKALEG